MIMIKFGLFLIVLASASETKEYEDEKSGKDLILVKIEEEEYKARKKTSKYIGVGYNETKEEWQTFRWSKNEKKILYNGCYKDEETAAHASDDLARKLITNGEQNHKLNFPDDDTEVHPEESFSSIYIGVTYFKRDNTWCVQRHSKNQKKKVHNGTYNNEKTAAYASDTLARKLMANGEQNHKLNFPYDNNVVNGPEKKKTSKYIGVFDNNRKSLKWTAFRQSQDRKRNIYGGRYKDEEKAAHVSDTLARRLITKGEKNHKLNFPEDHTKVYPENVERTSIYIGVTNWQGKKMRKWRVQRWSKYENKNFYNGSYKDEETAAHASDNLARKLMANGEQNHELNFPKDNTEVCHQRNKRKRSEDENLGHSENR